MNVIKMIFDYKIKALNQIILNDNIVKVLSDNTPQFYDNTDQSILDNRDSLIYTLIYPYMPVTSQLVDAHSYITLSLGEFDSDDNSTQNGWIELYIICHKSLISTEVGQRHGFIANEIDNMIYNTRGFGIGRIVRRKFGEFHLGSEKDFVGVNLRYYITDFSIYGSI